MSKGRILIVEDDKIIALEIKERLDEFGYDVIAMVKTGYLAIEQAIMNKPELIIMDISLEGEIDGIAAAERIQKIIDVPIIYLTALSDDITINRAKFTTPYGYIVKPFHERELSSAVEIALYKHKTERILKDSEAKYKAIINSLEAELYLVSEDRKIVFSNRPADRNIEDEKINKTCYRTLFNRNIVCENCGLDSVKDGETISREIYDEKKKCWYTVISSPLYLSDGSFYNQHLVFNITDQKNKESNLSSLVEEKDLLLREVNHRVKNNMQMMLSLLKLQISDNIGAEAEHNLKTFEQRIKSMILVQEDLNTNSLVSMISFRAYTAKLADNLTNAYNINSEKIKINIDADDLLLPPEVAIPCGLIINELLTNSVRHAFPQDSEGEISLKISGDSSSFEMIVKDNGNGLAEKNKKTKSSGLGLQLVDTLVSQLGGKMTVLNKTGMEYRINVNTALNNEV